MKLVICSAIDALRFASQYKQYDVISIVSDSDKRCLMETHGVDIDEIHSLCDNVLRLFFDENESIAETFKQVQHTLDWVTGRSNVIVHCSEGICRSSALAYVIACSQMSVDHAVDMLNLKVHDPDMNIVEMGSQILGNKKMLKLLKREQKRVQRKWMET